MYKNGHTCNERDSNQVALRQLDPNWTGAPANAKSSHLAEKLLSRPGMKALNRREFIGSSIAGTAMLVGGQSSKAAASERLRVGCVGVNGRAGQLVSMFAGLKEVEVVALADVDSRKLPGAAQRVEKIQGKKPATETDFRKLI